VSTRRIILLGVVSALLVTKGLAASTTTKPVRFNEDIRPILSDNCFGCHGPDEKKRKAKLRLDTFEGATKVSQGTQAIKPRDLAGSELWSRIHAKDPDDVMPPPESNKKLTPAQVDTLRRWIEGGAQYQGHWAFEAPRRAALPTIAKKHWPKNEIDYFIAAKLAEKNLKPENEASKETLIRRVSFDLTGLPPTPSEVDAFLSDRKADAYERLVDRLLASPRYGEQQARYWLDAVRYGDTHGLHLDNERSMWPYRDWVVKALNENMPFDQFTVWQIAGDLLPNATMEQKLASGYNRCNVTTSEGGSIDDEYYVRYAIDRTDTTCVNWMALTAGCAVCHDHKFDPISQKEFYSLYSFFNNNKEKAMDGNAALVAPVIKLKGPEQDNQLKELDKEIAALKKQIAQAIVNVNYKDPFPQELKKFSSPQEVVVLEDEVPAGAKASVNENTAALEFIAADKGEVFSGKKAMKRTATGLAQDIFENLKAPLIVSTNDKIFAYVFINPTNPPKAVMLQFHTTEWLYRANWGDADAIPYGEKGTSQKVQMGPLPKAGEWVRLEVDTAKLEMKTGLRVNGIAFTQFGGTVYWDKTGVMAELAQEDHSAESQWAWEAHQRAENGATLPAEIAKLIRSKVDEKNQKQLRNYYIENVFAPGRSVFDPLHAKSKPLQEKRKQIEDSIPGTMVMEEMEKPRGAFVLRRGEYDQKLEEVQAGVPRIFPALPKTEKTNRLALAQWLVATNHPLTSRVIVNRYWQQFFGTGLVKTAQDFGSQGDWPSHPELLDWLAVHFMDTHWDIKAMHKLMVTSAAYRQDSRVTAKKLEIDPENRFLSRGPRFRLDAEQIRDNALFVSGLLEEKIGGRGVRPYQPEGIWEAVAYTASNTAKYVQDHGPAALYRRSLYTFWKRTAPSPAMITFDAPSREKYCVRRERTDTPLQALVTMNDTQFVEASRHLGERIMEQSKNVDHQVDFGFRLLTARHPSRDEGKILKQSLEKFRNRYRTDISAATNLISVGESASKKDLDPSELAAYTMFGSLLLNLDETVNKN
jgi:hypothetical protein